MPYRPTPNTEAKKQAMWSRIMASARSLFIEQGYEATTLPQIVKRAKTSIGNCYFYFPNKEAILLAIGEEFRTEVAEEIDHAIADLLFGPELLATAIYTGMLATIERADVARITLVNTALPSLKTLAMEMFSARVRRAFEANPQLFEGWSDATPGMAAAAYHGALYYVLENWISGRIQEDRFQVARFAARWNLQALGLPHQVVLRAISSLTEEGIQSLRDVVNEPVDAMTCTIDEGTRPVVPPTSST